MAIIDLFAGPGGASLGFRQAGFDILAAVESDSTAAASYSRNNLDTVVLTRDIREIPAAEILDAAQLLPGQCTVVIACPPCQGFSTHRLNGAGTHDPRNELVLLVAELIAAIRPMFFLFENVPGLLRDMQSPWPLARSTLEAEKYKMIQGILDAANYGVPQRRSRFTVLGWRTPGPDLGFPPKSHADPRKQNHLLTWKTVRQTIADLVPLDNGERCTSDNLHRASCHTHESLKRFQMIPPNGGSRKSLPVDLQLECHKSHEGHKDVYGRLWWDKPAGTITAGCTQPSKGRFLHPEQNRGLTLREAARLQGFPDSYEFEGNKQQIGLQIGNAVPPPLAYAFAVSLKGALAAAEEPRQPAAVGGPA